ncbi:MAG: hypothetical protein IT290_03315 [Deltaproteobacteria bacterium]|nr:hypothetical protein [Deltaproteobacteria bacterium]
MMATASLEYGRARPEASGGEVAYAVAAMIFLATVGYFTYFFTPLVQEPMCRGCIELNELNCLFCELEASGKLFGGAIVTSVAMILVGLGFVLRAKRRSGRRSSGVVFGLVSSSLPLIFTLGVVASIYLGLL